MTTKQYKTPFIRTQKQEDLLMKVTLIMYQIQPIVLLYQTYKNLYKNGSGQIMDSVTDHNISIKTHNPFFGSSYIELAKEFDHQKKV